MQTCKNFSSISKLDVNLWAGFMQARNPSCHPRYSIKALKGLYSGELNTFDKTSVEYYTLY